MAVVTPRNALLTVGFQIRRVFDGNGLEWENLAQVDTETGESVQYLKNEAGRYYLSEAGLVATRTVILPLPIRFEGRNGE